MVDFVVLVVWDWCLLMFFGVLCVWVMVTCRLGLLGVMN